MAKRVSCDLQIARVTYSECVDVKLGGGRGKLVRGSSNSWKSHCEVEQFTASLWIFPLEYSLIADWIRCYLIEYAILFLQFDLNQFNSRPFSGSDPSLDSISNSDTKKKPRAQQWKTTKTSTRSPHRGKQLDDRQKSTLIMSVHQLY